MSIRVMSDVWRRSRFAGAKLLILLALADFADDEGRCWPSIGVLAAKARLTNRGVQKILLQLIAGGELVREKAGCGRGKSARYRIVVGATKDEQHSTNCIHRTLNAEYEHQKGERHATFNHSSQLYESSLIRQKRTIPSRPSSSSKTEPREPTGFARFYEAYPRKQGRADALKAWRSLKLCPETIARVVADVATRFRETEVRFVPMPAKYLRGRRWEDDPAVNGLVAHSRQTNPTPMQVVKHRIAVLQEEEHHEGN